MKVRQGNNRVQVGTFLSLGSTIYPGPVEPPGPVGPWPDQNFDYAWHCQCVCVEILYKTILPVFSYLANIILL